MLVLQGVQFVGGGLELVVRRFKAGQQGARAVVCLASVSASGNPIAAIAKRHRA